MLVNVGCEYQPGALHSSKSSANKSISQVEFYLAQFTLVRKNFFPFHRKTRLHVSLFSGLCRFFFRAREGEKIWQKRNSVRCVCAHNLSLRMLCYSAKEFFLFISLPSPPLPLVLQHNSTSSWLEGSKPAWITQQRHISQMIRVKNVFCSIFNAVIYVRALHGALHSPQHISSRKANLIHLVRSATLWFSRKKFSLSQHKKRRWSFPFYVSRPFFCAFCRLPFFPWLISLPPLLHCFMMSEDRQMVARISSSHSPNGFMVMAHEFLFPSLPLDINRRKVWMKFRGKLIGKCFKWGVRSAGRPWTEWFTLQKWFMKPEA